MKFLTIGFIGTILILLSGYFPSVVQLFQRDPLMLYITASAAVIIVSLWFGSYYSRTQAHNKSLEYYMKQKEKEKGKERPSLS